MLRRSRSRLKSGKRAACCGRRAAGGALQAATRVAACSYKQGKITELIFDGEDEVWSENVKRAVMSTLHVNMVSRDE